MACIDSKLMSCCKPFTSSSSCSSSGKTSSSFISIVGRSRRLDVLLLKQQQAQQNAPIVTRPSLVQGIGNPILRIEQTQVSKKMTKQEEAGILHSKLTFVNPWRNFRAAWAKETSTAIYPASTSVVASTGPSPVSSSSPSSTASPSPGPSPARPTQGFVADALFSKLPGLESETHFANEEKNTKVTVVGVGNVGMACAQTILTQNLADIIALVDVVPDKLRGEMLDLQHAAAFLPNVTIMADTDYKVTAGSDICIITAGARQREGEDRLSLVDRNVKIFQSIVPRLVKYSPDTILLVISNPVDILTWATWKISGFPPTRVIGSGTTLDSSRFRALIAQNFQVSAQSVHAHILGEHGDTSVPLWDSMQVAGVPITKFLKSRGIQSHPESLRKAHKVVVDGAYEVIKLKGYTSWAIGYSVAQLVSSLMRNQKRVHPVSVLANGFHGIEDEVFLSLPAVLGRAGVVAVANSVLSQEERSKLQESARGLYDIQKRFNF